MAKSLGPMKRDDVVWRARSVMGSSTRYVLSKGGRDPRASHPGELIDGRFCCDCSGHAAWTAGVDRFLPNGGIPHLEGRPWFETSNLYADARSPFGFVAEVPWTAALPGDLLVWPDRRNPKREGHVGVVVEVDHTGPVSVVHCSATNFKRFGDAIRETGVEVFRSAGAIVARLAWVS